MSKTVKDYTLTAAKAKNCLTYGIPLSCNHCGRALRIGRKIRSRRGEHTSKLYHIRCAETVNICP